VDNRAKCLMCDASVSKDSQQSPVRAPGDISFLCGKRVRHSYGQLVSSLPESPPNRVQSAVSGWSGVPRPNP